MKTRASCRKLPKNRTARKKQNTKTKLFPKVLRVYNATRYLYLSSFPTISNFKAASLEFDVREQT